MAFERFTDRARKILNLAAAEAARRGDDAVDTVHVLFGMIREGRGIAGVALREYDLDADKVARAYDGLRGEPDVTLVDLEARCRLEAEWFGHHYCGTEHLLLGVCSLNNSRAARLIESLGVHPVELCHFAVEILGHDDNWERWLSDHADLAHDG